MKALTASAVRLKKRRQGSHKGENGRVLVVGGSAEYTGAVLLASMAAYRSGVDWVQVVAPAKVAWAINALSPDIVTTKVPGKHFTAKDAKKVVVLAGQFDVMLIGNGIGRHAETKRFAAAVIKKCAGKKVIDADAIAAVRLQDVRNAVLTPHQGEYAHLMKVSGNTALCDNVMLLKGKTDVIMAEGKTARNRTGNAGMTVAGSGDVLAGLVAGFIAQGESLFRAACAAAYVNGRAGDRLYRKKGHGYLASELLDEVPNVVRLLRHG